MPFPTDPLDPTNEAVDRVRLIVGDVDANDLEFPEALYSYWLLVNSDDENKAAIQALQAMVAKYAKAMEEEVGEVRVLFQQRYNGYKDLLDRLLKDPAYGFLGAIQMYAGGLSFSEKRTDANDSDLRTNPFSVGSSINRGGKTYQAPFYKGEEEKNLEV